MVISCWSVKGGSGTTVVAAALSMAWARRRAGALLVDLGGDLPAALGITGDGPGVVDWCGLEEGALGGGVLTGDALACDAAKSRAKSSFG